jgi:hypothetical protein
LDLKPTARRMQNNRFEVKEKNSVHMNYSNGQQHKKLGCIRKSYRHVNATWPSHIEISKVVFFSLFLSRLFRVAGREGETE